MEFGNPIVGTEDLIRTAIKSPNYEAGVAGWIIRQDGTAEFLDIIARGNITADSIVVPFINQEDKEYRIAIREGNVDQPAIEFEFDGVTNTFDDGFINVEAFDSATGWGEITIRPMQPDVIGLGNPPNIRIQSHAADGDAGTIDFLGSTAFGDESADDRPLFRVSDNFGIDIETLRPETAVLGSDSTRAITSTTFTSNIDGDELAVTIPPAASGAIQVSLWAQADITAGAGFIAFEVCANNGSGTQLQGPVDGTGIILVNLAGARISYFFQVPVEDTDFLLTPLFVRCMAHTSSGGTLTIQRARLTAQVLP